MFGEHLRLVGVEDVLLPDELVLVGVDDRAVFGPQLDPNQRPAEHGGVHPLVESLDRVVVTGQQSVVGVGLDDALGDVEGRILGVVDGLLGADTAAGERGEHADQRERGDCTDAETDDELPDRRGRAIEVLLQLGVGLEDRGLQGRRRARARLIRDVCAHPCILPGAGLNGNGTLVLRLDIGTRKTTKEISDGATHPTRCDGAVARTLHSHRDKLGELVDLGYTDIWSAESDGADAFTPLALAAAWEPRLRLGTAIVPAFTRSPACLAQCVASLADAAPGRFAIGIGSSSNVIVERWNGVPFVEPYKKVRDVVRFLGDAFDRREGVQGLRHVRGAGFRLGVRPEQKPPILVAALREGMLRLAAREADGAIINWLSATDVDQGGRCGRALPPEAPRRRSCVGSSCARARTPRSCATLARYAIAAYLNVPVYAAFHDWLGRGEVLRPMWDAWKAGDRKGALAAIPDSLVDELIVHGSPADCRAKIQAYFDNGVTTTSLAIMPLDPDLKHWEAVQSLAPRAG